MDHAEVTDVAELGRSVLESLLIDDAVESSNVTLEELATDEESLDLRGCQRDACMIRLLPGGVWLSESGTAVTELGRVGTCLAVYFGLWGMGV